jgi:hypothetical protein
MGLLVLVSDAWVVIGRGDALECRGQIGNRPVAAGAVAIQIIPAVATLQTPAAAAVAQVGLFEGCHADLAAALGGLWAKGAIPPLLLRGKKRDAVLDTELAAAVLEAPAGFVADLEGAARAGEGESSGAEATVAETAAAAGEVLDEDDGGAGEKGNGNSEPGG